MKTYFERFKNPGVVLGLVSLVVELFVLFGYEVDINWVNAVAITVCNILAVFGIMNNPDTPGMDIPTIKNNNKNLG